MKLGWDGVTSMVPGRKQSLGRESCSALSGLEGLGGSGAIGAAAGPTARGRERRRQQLGLGAGMGLLLGSGLHFVVWGSPVVSKVILGTV